MSSITLFVYGTLKRGERSHSKLAGQEFLGTARTAPRYRLYARPTFPCLVEDPQGYAVEGELWRVADTALRELDAFEVEFLFVRSDVSVEGATEPVIAYLYRGETDGLRDCGTEWRG